jgi:hypothetical protein
MKNAQVGGHVLPQKGLGPTKHDEHADQSRSQDTRSLNTQLLVVLRDFDKEQLEGKQPNDHLNEWLEEVPNAPKDSALQEQNKVRASIKNLFRKRNCLTIARPGRKTTGVIQGVVSPEFLDDLDEVKLFIQQNIQPIAQNGVDLDGDAFASLVENSVNLVNEGTPLLVSRLASLARDFNSRLVQKCMESYTRHTNARGPARNLSMLNAIHEVAKEASMQELKKVRFATLRDVHSFAVLHRCGSADMTSAWYAGKADHSALIV